MVYTWIKFVQSTLAAGLFPGRCILCGHAAPSRTMLCPLCANELPVNQPACPRCAQVMPACDPGARPPLLCGACMHHPPHFDRAISAWQYAGAVPHLVTTLKFRHGLHLIHPLAEGLLATLRAQPRTAWPEAILPMPLHPSRLRERGFNQALELARPLGHRLGLAVERALCRRTRMTAAQSTLTLRQRKANVRGAFEVTTHCPWRHVALLDDVLTTGHTADELSRVLKRAGVEYVEVWSVARATTMR